MYPSIIPKTQTVIYCNSQKSKTCCKNTQYKKVLSILSHFTLWQYSAAIHSHKRKHLDISQLQFPPPLHVPPPQHTQSHTHTHTTHTHKHSHIHTHIHTQTHTHSHTRTHTHTHTHHCMYACPRVPISSMVQHLVFFLFIFFPYPIAAHKTDPWFKINWQQFF